jgi:hypothetical protein
MGIVYYKDIIVEDTITPNDIDTSGSLSSNDPDSIDEGSKAISCSML